MKTFFKGWRLHRLRYSHSVSGPVAQSLSPSTKTHWDKGTLVVETPERPAGQEHVLGLTAPNRRQCVWLS